AQRFAERKDIVALGELVERAREAWNRQERDVRAPRMRQNFMEEFLRTEEELGEYASRPERLAADIMAQRSIGSVAFGDKDREYCSLAAKAFSAWARLRAPWKGASTARQIAGDVACVLSFLKIPIASAADVKIEQDIAW